MKINNIYLKEVPYSHWSNLRLSNGVRSQREYNWPDERIAYGLIVDPLEYKDFVELFEDLSSEDFWLEGFGVQAENKRKNYYGFHLRSIIDGDLLKNRQLLMESLESADKVTVGMKSDNSKKVIDHIHFRRHGSSVYSGSIRVKPYQLDNFQSWGFNDPAIMYAKADFFPIQNASKPARVYAELSGR